MNKHPNASCCAQNNFLRCRLAGLSGRVGFTLIELLTVIAIVAVLATILLPVVGSVKEVGVRTACAGNMRQIGLAIESFSAEHNGRLPGEKNGTPYGIFVQVGAVYGEWPDEKYTLIEYLRHYMDLPKAPGIAQTMMCPGVNPLRPQYADRNDPEKYKVSYFLNRYVRHRDGTIVPPFGRDWSQDRLPLFNDDLEDPSRSVALYDADQQIHTIAGNPGRPESFAPEPVHGKVRNFLFLDGHVESLPLDFDPRQQPR